MIDQPFRARLEVFAKPITTIYRALKLRPNHISILGLMTAAGAAVALANGHFILALATWWLSRFFDGTDGLYARESGQASAFGAYFDIVLDMAAYSTMILGFAAIFPQLHWQWTLIVALYVLCITSALSLGALERKAGVGAGDNRGLKLGAGLAEGGETGLMYSVMLIFPQFISFLTLVWIAVLSFTVIARTVLAAKELE